jgi:hypothetical protein
MLAKNASEERNQRFLTGQKRMKKMEKDFVHATEDGGYEWSPNLEAGRALEGDVIGGDDDDGVVRNVREASVFGWESKVSGGDEIRGKGKGGL